MNEADVRKRLLDALEADPIGPFVPDSHPEGGQEILPIAPSRWYLTGFLAPQRGRVPAPEELDSTEEMLAGAGAQHGGSAQVWPLFFWGSIFFWPRASTSWDKIRPWTLHICADGS